MRIATWNVNGIRAREAQVVSWVLAQRPDVVCLQEIKATPEQVPASLCDLEGYWCRWHGMKAYSGVGLHLRKDAFDAEPEFFHPAFDLESRIVAARLPGLVVASVYVPNGNKDYPAKVRFLEALVDWVGETVASGVDLAVCGDLNVARAEIDVHPKERKPQAIGQLPEERALFERLLGRGVVDVGRALDPENEGLFTWWAPWRNLRQRNIGWRLDYVLASRGLASRATACPVFREVGTSDHGPVLATFDDGRGTTAPRPA
jgi:exodeoxyribonuclease-3